MIQFPDGLDDDQREEWAWLTVVCHFTDAQAAYLMRRRNRYATFGGQYDGAFTVGPWMRRKPEQNAGERDTE